MAYLDLSGAFALQYDGSKTEIYGSLSECMLRGNIRESHILMLPSPMSLVRMHVTR